MLDESQTGRQAAARSAVGDLYDVLEENGNDWQRVRPRKIQAEQLRKLEGHAREIFETLGMDLSSPATEHTPRRLGPSLVLTTPEKVRRGCGGGCLTVARYERCLRANQASYL
jgi:hypothetical protein